MFDRSNILSKDNVTPQHTCRLNTWSSKECVSARSIVLWSRNLHLTCVSSIKSYIADLLVSGKRFTSSERCISHEIVYKLEGVWGDHDEPLRFGGHLSDLANPPKTYMSMYICIKTQIKGFPKLYESASDVNLQLGLTEGLLFKTNKSAMSLLIDETRFLDNKQEAS